jgi:hypothetical protein
MKFDIRNMLIIGVFPGLVLLAVSSERLLCASEFRPLAAPGESPIPPIFGTSRFSQRPSRRSISRRRAYSGCIWLFLVGAASYRWIEAPAKRAIRNWAMGGVRAPAG